jgi:chorismate mutase
MNKLKELQSKIDEINSKILNLVIKRNQIVKKIKEHKKEKNLPVYNPKREKDIHKKMQKAAEKKNLNKKFVRKLFSLIIKQSRK